MYWDMVDHHGTMFFKYFSVSFRNMPHFSPEMSFFF
jgi:hypothetical protein